MVWTWAKGLPSPLVCPLQRVTHPEPQGPGLDLALGEFSQKIVSVGLPLAANNSISNSSSKFFLGGGGLYHMVSGTSLTRDRTYTPCSGRAES